MLLTSFDMDLYLPVVSKTHTHTFSSVSKATTTSLAICTSCRAPIRSASDPWTGLHRPLRGTGRCTTTYSTSTTQFGWLLDGKYIFRGVYKPPFGWGATKTQQKPRQFQCHATLIRSCFPSLEQLANQGPHSSRVPPLSSAAPALGKSILKSV